MYRLNRSKYTQPVAVTSPGADMMTGLSVEGTVIKLEDELAKWTVPTDVLIEEFEPVSSYNWTASTPATIIVPGSPKEWNDKALPFRVPKDSGIQYINQNAYRLPSYPLLPLVSAVLHTKPTYKFSELDLISDRNNLRKLLRWIDGKANDRDFRIDMHFVGHKTVVLNRWDEKTTEFGGRGYGHSFEDATTRHAHGCEGGTGHHRIVSYSFNGLKVLLRFEVDACLTKRSPTSKTNKSIPSISSDEGLDDLSSVLGGLSINSATGGLSANAVTPNVKNTTLQIKDGGTLVPQESLIEMTTRSTKSFESFDWADPYPQILLSQTKHLYVAVHNFGTFQEIHKYELGKGIMKSVEARVDKSITNLRAVLEGLINRAKRAGVKGGLSLVCKDGVLKVHKRIDPKPCFPEDVMKHFDKA